MRYLSLFLVLLLAAGSAAAQRLAATAPPDSLVAVQPAPDTAAALHRLFAGRRHRRNAIAIGLGAGLVLNSIDASLTADEQAAGRPGIVNLGSAPGGAGSTSSGGTPVATTWLLAVLPTSALIGLDYLAYASFSRKKEARAIAAYQTGKLPLHLKNKLRAKHFRPVAPAVSKELPTP